MQPHAGDIGLSAGKTESAAKESGQAMRRACAIYAASATKVISELAESLFMLSEGA